jgi:hypothetical protein
MSNIRLRFDGDFAEGLTFVEAENEDGESINVGEWSEEDGDKILTIPTSDLRDEEEIRKNLEKLRNDNRLTEYDKADVRTNAPLALHQAAGEAKISVLQWVLQEGDSNDE